jgi:uncharacterized protein
MFLRLLNPTKLNSFLLFGARGTGKSTFLAEFFKQSSALWLDLLDYKLEKRLLADPSQIREMWNQSRKEWVVIDEVQKIPQLLDVVHSMIEKEKVKFALTGSSARKLKRGNANLLAGRAFSYNLFPLSFLETFSSFQLEDALQFGSLPKIYQFSNPSEKKKYLDSYAHTYLKEEIFQEQLVRKMDSFRHFLPVAALSCGRPLNYAKIARDSGVDAKSVERYFVLLEDTLLGFFLDSYHRSIRSRQKNSLKFYFFDVGVQRALAETLDVPVLPQTSYYGEVFEAFVISEAYKLASYHEKRFRFSYLQTTDGMELDLVIEQGAQVKFLVEIKSTEQVRNDSCVNLKNLALDFPASRRLILCRETFARKRDDGIEIFPWQEGLREIFK